MSHRPRAGEIASPLTEPRRVEILPEHEPVTVPEPEQPVREPVPAT